LQNRSLATAASVGFTVLDLSKYATVYIPDDGAAFGPEHVVNMCGNMD
jgi:hypothetical protein